MRCHNLWSFGDGATSTEQNPSHSFTTAGTYTVVFTAYRGTECLRNSTQTITIGRPVQLLITSIVVQSTTLPLAAGYFEDNSPDPQDLDIGNTEPEVSFLIGSCFDNSTYLQDVIVADLPMTIVPISGCMVGLLNGVTSIPYSINEVDLYLPWMTGVSASVNIDSNFSTGSIDISEYFLSNNYPSVISHSDAAFTFDLHVIWE